MVCFVRESFAVLVSNTSSLFFQPAEKLSVGLDFIRDEVKLHCELIKTQSKNPALAGLVVGCLEKLYHCNSDHNRKDYAKNNHLNCH